MKYSFVFIIAFIFTFCAKQKEKAIPLIEGNLKNCNQERLYLFKNEQSKILIDTIEVKQDGSFKFFSNNIDTIGFFLLEFDSLSIDLFIHPHDNVKISFDCKDPIKTIKSGNSSISNSLFDLKRNTLVFSSAVDRISLKYDNTINKELNDSLLNNISKARDSIMLYHKLIAKSIISESNSPITTFYALNQKWKNTSLFSVNDDFELFFNNSMELKNSELYYPIFKNYINDFSRLSNIVNAEKRYNIRGKFPILKAKTNWNESVNTDKMNAKLVFVVLWNGEKEHIAKHKSFISKINRKFGRYGLKTLMVGYSKNKKVWLSNITSLNLPYWHIIDTLGINSNDLSKMAINNLPFNFTLNSDSTIIARNIWDEKELTKTLNNFLKK